MHRTLKPIVFTTQDGVALSPIALDTLNIESLLPQSLMTFLIQSLFTLFTQSLLTPPQVLTLDET